MDGRRHSAVHSVAEKVLHGGRAPAIQTEEIIHAHASPEEEKRVLRKIDMRVIPLMMFCYMLQFMDKASLGYSTQLGLIKDLHLEGSQFSWTSSIFYFGYLIWCWPSSYLSVRFPIAKYLSLTVVAWGVVLMCHAATTNFAGIATTRFLLGMTESGVAPGFSLIIGMFYKRSEQPARQGLWFAGNGIANITTGLISYGIGTISGAALATWRILFLILGAITVLWGAALFLLLPDSPSTARFLTPAERAIALRRTLANKTGVQDEGAFRAAHMREALRDPQAWLLALFMLAASVPNGGVTTFNSIIVAGFGFGRLDALLLQTPGGAVQLVAIALGCGLASRFPGWRLPIMLANLLLAVAGMVMVYVIPDSAPYGRLAGLWIINFFVANTPLSLSLITSNVAGFTKKATVSAMLFAAYCVGNIIGPQFFITSEEPRYPTGIRAVMAGFAVAFALLVLLLAYYVFENRRRDRRYGGGGGGGGVPAVELEDELSNRTDRELKSFRYTY